MRPRGREQRVRWLLPWPIAVALILVLHIGSMWWLPGLRLNNAPDLYYPAGSAAVVLRDELRRDFPSDELLTVVLQGPDLFTRDVLQRVDAVVADLQEHPLVDRVTAVTTMERISGSEDGFEVVPLVPLDAAVDDPAALKQRVLEDRFAPGLLASRDGSTLALAVRPKDLAGSGDRLLLQIATFSAIREAGLTAYYAGDAGPITVDVAQLQSMIGDTALFVPLTGALGLALLYWVVGSLRPVLIGAAALSTVILPVIAGIAIAGQPYTMASAILPSLLAAYTMATLLHLYAGIQRAQAAGLSKRSAVHQALKETVRPALFNVLTTGAGLISLVLVPMPPIQVFGIAGAAGTAVVFLTVYLLVPPLLLRWDRQPWRVHASNMERMGRIAARLAVFGMRRPVAVAGATLALLALAVPLAMQVKVETDVLAFFDPHHPVNRSTRLVEAELAGVTSLEVSVRASSRDGLLESERLRALRALQDWLESQPEIDRTVSMADLVEEMHWAMNAEQSAFRTIPDDDRLIRQYMLVYDGRDLYELVNRDFDHARIMLNLSIHGASEIGRAIRRIEERLQQHPLPGLEVEIGGYGRLFADQVDLLVTGQLRSFAAAFVLILLLLAVLWRSLGGAAACMVPNVAPLLCVLVLMGATGIHLDMATVMIAGVVLGITVDDTIHLYHAHSERLRQGQSLARSVVGAYLSTGRAVLATTVLVTAQFALLATSAFIPTAHFGTMTAVGLLAGHVAEFLLLPPLLVFVHRLRSGALSGALLQRRALGGEAARQPSPDDWQPTVVVERPDRLPSTVPEPDHSGTRLSPAVGHVLVCAGPACLVAGAQEAIQALAQPVSMSSGPHSGSASSDLAVCVAPVCLGRCEEAPVVQAVVLLPACKAGSPVERARAAALMAAAAPIAAGSTRAVEPTRDGVRPMVAAREGRETAAAWDTESGHPLTPMSHGGSPPVTRARQRSSET